MYRTQQFFFHHFSQCGNSSASFPTLPSHGYSYYYENPSFIKRAFSRPNKYMILPWKFLPILSEGTRSSIYTRLHIVVLRYALPHYFLILIGSFIGLVYPKTCHNYGLICRESFFLWIGFAEVSTVLF